MKILIVGPNDSPIIQRLVINLKDHGYEVLIASFNARSGNGVVSLGTIKSFLDYFKFFKINKVVRDFQPDVVHAHVVNHYGLISILQKKPLLVALWGSDVMVSANQGHVLKRMIFSMLNFIVLKRATRCHTSAYHVAEEADKQCNGVLKKTDVFYWGFPLVRPNDNEMEGIRYRLHKEFGLNSNDLLVFPRGLGHIYNPEATAMIINNLVNKYGLSKEIVVLKGFSNNEDEKYFKSLVNINSITYINRLLTSEELYFLYSITKIHFSIPLSDSLGGGVVEPALLGSYPILSNLKSYTKYAENNKSLILQDYEDSTINSMCERIKNGEIGKSSENIPVEYTLQRVLKNFFNTYDKVKNNA